MFGMFKKQKEKVIDKPPVGVSGTPIYGGFIVSNEKDASLVGIHKYTTFSEMLANVGIVAAGTRYFLNLVAKAGWSVVPPKGSGAEGQRIADMIDDILHSMDTPWHSVVRRAAMYRFYGFSIQEWTARLFPDGKIGYATIDPRPQYTIERWYRDNFGKIESVLQRDPENGDAIVLPRRKIVYVVDDSLSDSPEGLGLFRHVALAAKRLQRYEQLEGFGFETDLRGVPIGRAPLAVLQNAVKNNQLSQKEADAILAPMKTFMENHLRAPGQQLGLLTDSYTYTTEDEAARPSSVHQWDIELLKSSATSQPEVALAIERETRNIARVLGVEQLLLGETSIGSYALSKDKSNNFALIIDGTLMELAWQFGKDIIDPLFMLNGWDEELKPTLKTESIEYRDIEQVTGALKNMAQSGAMLAPDDPVINAIRKILGVPELDFTNMETNVSLMDEPENEENNQDAEFEREEPDIDEEGEV